MFVHLTLRPQQSDLGPADRESRRVATNLFGASGPSGQAHPRVGAGGRGGSPVRRRAVRALWRRLCSHPGRTGQAHPWVGARRDDVRRVGDLRGKGRDLEQGWVELIDSRDDDLVADLQAVEGGNGILVGRPEGLQPPLRPVVEKRNRPEVLAFTDRVRVRELAAEVCRS